MITKADKEELQALFDAEFRELVHGKWSEWRRNYIEFVGEIRAASEEEWLKPEFQRRLWDQNPIADIRQGRSVTVVGAYGDRELALLTFKARDELLPTSVDERGRRIQTLFDELMAGVKKHTTKRPQARALRLFAALFPHDMTSIADQRRLWQVSATLGLQPSKDGFVAQHALVREALRSALGPTDKLEDDIEQSIFAWFVWEHYCAQPDSEGKTTKTDKGATDLKQLLILPPSVQRKGLMYVGNNVPLLVSMVREVEEGLSRSDLLSVIQREAPQLKSAGSASNIISQAQGGLALIRLSDGAYRPTALGLELLKVPDPAQVLQPILIGRIFGIGQLLLALKDAASGIARKPLAERLSSLIPTRKSLWSGGELINWAVAAKLASLDGNQVRLTDDGTEYAEALPEDFSEKWRFVPEPEDGPGELVDPPFMEEGSGQDKFKAASWQAVRQRVAASDISGRLELPEGMLAELHSALHATARKRFVLLAGLSGTGKTSVTRTYAQAYCAAVGIQDFDNHYRLVAVRPDWTDPSGLLGYVNPIAEAASFQPGEALELILSADRDRSRPYFLCLDEMNLARVEHYFAPFLSAMEGEAGWLSIHSEDEAVGSVPPRVEWPVNLFILGTVNMDESTHPFSDKVLDRAFVLEFWDVDLEAWEKRRRAAGALAVVLDEVAPLLRRLHPILSKAKRQFAYRVADEVLGYCSAGHEAGAAPAGMLDSAILAKVLPRLRGDDSGPLKVVLDELLIELPVGSFPRSRRKIEDLASQLSSTGQARFWT